jgi:hypothetical protein
MERASCRVSIAWSTNGNSSYWLRIGGLEKLQAQAEILTRSFHLVCGTFPILKRVMTYKAQLQ